MMDEKVTIFGIQMFSANKARVLEVLSYSLRLQRKDELLLVATVNPEQIVQAAADDSFRSVLNQFSVCVADGMGIVWAAKLFKLRGRLKGTVPTRISGVELAEELVTVCAKEGLKVMLLGGKGEVAAKAAGKLEVRIQESGVRGIQDTGTGESPSPLRRGQGVRSHSLNVIGIPGSKNIALETPEERESVLSQIRTFKPALLLVAYGAPWQERWLFENKKELEEAGVRVAMVIGGAVDVWAGKVKRAPLMMRKLGLEWLWRLINEPWRWKRQLRLIRFISMTIKEMI